MDVQQHSGCQTADNLLTLQQISLFRLDEGNHVKQLLTAIDIQLMCCWDENVKKEMKTNLYTLIYELSKLVHN